MTMTAHAKSRAQQRCMPPIVHTWLDQFGEEVFDGHGGIKLFFSHRSIRRMEQTFGRHFVQENRKYLRAYMVESSHDSGIITTGWRSHRVKRA